MADAPIERLHGGNAPAREFLDAILDLMDEDEFAHVDVIGRYAALQMALYTVFTAILAHYTPPDAFEHNRSTLMGLHKSLTESLEAVDVSIIQPLAVLDPSELVH